MDDHTSRLAMSYYYTNKGRVTATATMHSARFALAPENTAPADLVKIEMTDINSDSDHF
jgi:hypothetical protein